MVEKVFVLGTAVGADLAAMTWKDFRDQHAIKQHLSKFETHIVPFRLRGAWMLIIVRNACLSMNGVTQQPGQVFYVAMLMRFIYAVTEVFIFATHGRTNGRHYCQRTLLKPCAIW